MYLILISVLLVLEETLAAPTSARQHGRPSTSSLARCDRQKSPQDTQYEIRDPFNAHHEDYIKMLTGTPPFRVKLANSMMQRQQEQIVAAQRDARVGLSPKTPSLKPQSASAKQQLQAAPLQSSSSSGTITQMEHKITLPRSRLPDEILAQRHAFFNHLEWQTKFTYPEQKKIFGKIRSHWTPRPSKRAYKSAKLEMRHLLDEDSAEAILKDDRKVTGQIAKKAFPRARPVAYRPEWKRHKRTEEKRAANLPQK